jgi:hypothetical protein
VRLVVALVQTVPLAVQPLLLFLPSGMILVAILKIRILVVRILVARILK